MSQYAPLRDAFSELNKLLIDKQQWDAEHELRTAEMGLKKMQVEADMLDREQNRVIREQQVTEAKHAMEEVDANIYDFVKNDSYNQNVLFDTSNAGEQFAKMMTGERFSRVDRASGLIYDANGQKIKLPRMILASNAALANGVLLGAYDPEDMINNKVSTLDNQIKELSTMLKSTNPADVSRRKELKEQLALKQSERNKHASNLDIDKLAPFYRQRMDMVDNLVVQAAGSGASRATLTALQHVSSKVHADYNTLLTKLMAKEEQKFRKELQEDEQKFRLELEDKKDKKTESANMRYAAKFDANGSIIPGSTVAVNIPKNARESYLPEEVDPRLKGWVWATEKQIESRTKTKEDKPQENIAKTYIVRGWHDTAVDKITGEEKSVTIEANLPRENATYRVYGQLRNKQEFKNATEAEVATKAVSIVMNEELEFWREIARDMQLLAKEGEPIDTQEKFERMVHTYATKPHPEYKTIFYDDFGYIPKVEHIQSLVDKAGKFVSIVDEKGKTKLTPIAEMFPSLPSEADKKSGWFYKLKEWAK